MRRWTLATAMTVLLTASACGSADPEEADRAVPTDAPLVPVERSTDLVDPEGSVLGTAWLRDGDNDSAELEVEVAGLTPGFHGIRLFEVSSCDAVTAAAPSLLLSPMLVLENGVGSITTLVGPVSMDDLLEGGGVTVVLDEAVAGPADLGTGSQLACGAFAG